MPRAWRRWRRSKGRSPGFIALCEVSSSSSSYLSRHQILLVPLANLPLIIASSSSSRRLSSLAFVRFAFRSAPSSQRSGLRYICLAVGSGARLCSPPRQTQNRCCVLPLHKGVYGPSLSSSEFVLPLRPQWQAHRPSISSVLDRQTTRQVFGFIHSLLPSSCLFCAPSYSDDSARISVNVRLHVISCDLGVSVGVSLRRWV